MIAVVAHVHFLAKVCNIKTNNNVSWHFRSNTTFFWVHYSVAVQATSQAKASCIATQQHSDDLCLVTIKAEAYGELDLRCSGSSILQSIF